jgi:hypothetical protein
MISSILSSVRLKHHPLTVSKVLIEIWIRDTDGKAIQLGNREDLIPAAQLQMSIGDFLPPGYLQTITSDLDRFRTVLRYKIPPSLDVGTRSESTRSV